MWTPSPQSRNFDRSSADQATYTVSVAPDLVAQENLQTENASSSPQEIAVASAGFLVLISLWQIIRQNLNRQKESLTQAQSVAQNLAEAKQKISHLPCTRCHYFKVNVYLPCAVNPLVALKPEALNCSDFQPRDKTNKTASLP